MGSGQFLTRGTRRILSVLDPRDHKQAYRPVPPCTTLLTRYTLYTLGTPVHTLADVAAPVGTHRSPWWDEDTLGSEASLSLGKSL